MIKKGTFTIEYGLLIVILVVALSGMFIYLRSALCGRWRESIDAIGDGRLYFPGFFGDLCDAWQSQIIACNQSCRNVPYPEECCRNCLKSAGGECGYWDGNVYVLRYCLEECFRFCGGYVDPCDAWQSQADACKQSCGGDQWCCVLCLDDAGAPGDCRFVLCL